MTQLAVKPFNSMGTSRASQAHPAREDPVELVAQLPERLLGRHLAAELVEAVQLEVELVVRVGRGDGVRLDGNCDAVALLVGGAPGPGDALLQRALRSGKERERSEREGRRGSKKERGRGRGRKGEGERRTNTVRGSLREGGREIA
jgi:hypothetical protein